jgi:hypothetical protein
MVWDDAFAGLVESLGGLISVKQFLRRVDAGDQHIHFQLPLRGSLHQKKNYLSLATLRTLQDLKLWAGFDFSEYDSTVATHRSGSEAAEWDEKGNA